MFISDSKSEMNQFEKKESTTLNQSFYADKNAFNLNAK